MTSKPIPPPLIVWSGKPSPSVQAKLPPVPPPPRTAGPAVAPPAVVWGANARPAQPKLPPGAIQAKQFSRPSVPPPPVVWSRPPQPGMPQAKSAPPFATAQAKMPTSAQPAPRHTPPPHRVWPAAPRGGVVQRMNFPSGNLFPISSFAQNVFNTSGDVMQDDLDGNSKSSGRQKFWTESEANDTSLQNKYFTELGGVIAFLKINGQTVSVGRNSKAGAKFEFHDIGYENQGGLKDNFHAEDWCLEAFRDVVRRSKLSLADYLKKHYSASGNTGQGGKHVFSLRISFSSCLGCTVTIQKFKLWLNTELGVTNFIFRVKFLRPYKLAVTSTNSNSQSVKNFVSSIGYLDKHGIYVRMHPEDSTGSFTGTIPKSELLGVNNEGVSNTLGVKQLGWLTKTWTEQGANRKGKPSSSLLSTTSLTPVATQIYMPPLFHPGKHVPSLYCSKRTLGGKKCSRKATKPGGTCWQHR